jgi:hypothetical protein
MKVCETAFPLLFNRKLLYSLREYVGFGKLHVVGLQKADFLFFCFVLQLTNFEERMNNFV